MSRAVTYEPQYRAVVERMDGFQLLHVRGSLNVVIAALATTLHAWPTDRSWDAPRVTVERL